jgi:hypothetical protein
MKEVFQEYSALCPFSSFVQVALNETFQDCWIGRGSPISWMLYIIQATNHKFQFYEQMYIAYAIYRMQYKSITMQRCSHNSHFKVSKMTCEDKRYATLPLPTMKEVLNINSPNILKTLCTTYIVRTFKIIRKVFITTSPSEVGCLQVLGPNCYHHTMVG